MMKPPPDVLGGARLVRWSPIDDRHRPTGACRHIVGGKPLSPVAGLAICEEKGAYYLFYCDTDWNTLTDTWHVGLDDALHQAEFEYEGIASTWTAV